MRTVVHVSDLHFGRTRPELLAPLLNSIEAAAPDLVAVSGDLTQRARAGQFAAAGRFLAALPKPVLVVPGNHDVPLDAVWTRLFRPWRRYRRRIEQELEPCFRDDEIVVAGINTVTPFAWQRGWITRRAAARACAAFAGAGRRTRIVVTHHPFVHAPDQAHKALMRGSARSLRALAECGADIFLSGHLHSWRADLHRPLVSDLGPVLLIQAGTGLSTRLRGESNDYNVLRIEPGAVTIRRFAADEAASGFRCIAEKRFVREERGWRAWP
ncbi:MAG TPA: metallophosphoesterase [Stellaceae bacterium]|nr:metallophosphoesterase [Stellaceae bacterium]